MKAKAARAWAIGALCVSGLSGCMKWEDNLPEDFSAEGRGLFILNEGNFQYGNATMSFYRPETGEVENEVFIRANGQKLGDVAQSMTIRGNTGWVVVGNSHVVFAIDTDTFREKGRIEGLTSPRYIHFLSAEKAYITNLWDNRIAIVDPRRYEVTGYITVPGMEQADGSTEQMVQQGKYVYANCWSYQDMIIKIDSETDKVTDALHVGIQPSCIALDSNGKLWVLTDGGYEGSPQGCENPSLCRIDLPSFTIEQVYTFPSESTPSSLQTDGSGDTLYWLDGGVWRMSAEAGALPSTPFIAMKESLYYSMTIDPLRGDIYVADAIDYQQHGLVYRYTSAGELLQMFYVGINPGAFAWKSSGTDE